MTILFRERFPDITKHICGMCGKAHIEVYTRKAPDGDMHEITRCSDSSCHHEYIDITHYDSKVTALRKKYGLYKKDNLCQN